MTLRTRSKRKRADSESGKNDEDDAVLPSQPRERPDKPDLVVEKVFCNFCEDYADEIQECVDCGSYMCQQVEEHGTGCICVGTLQPDVPFRCLTCEPKNWRRQGSDLMGEEGKFPYGFTGHGGRKRSKLAWPLLLASLSLPTLSDRFMRDSLRVDLKNHYLAAQQNLSIKHGDIRATGEESSVAAMTKGADFIEHSIRSKVPANTFVLVDTHSTEATGHLQWGDGLYACPSDLIRRFCGDPLLHAMKRASESAKEMGDPQGVNRWYDATPSSRGGWRGLLLCTCSPTMRVPETFQDLKDLVERDIFDFVLGFAGSSTIPSQIRNVVAQSVERIAVDKTTGIWDSISRVVAQDQNLLQENAVVLIYRERGMHEVMARKIARHSTPLRPWGVDFRACATPGCNPDFRDFYVRCEGDMDVRTTCRRCRWQSEWVKAADRKDLLFQIDSTLPTVFWHEYPASETLKNLFVDVTGVKRAKKAEAENKAKEKAEVGAKKAETGAEAEATLEVVADAAADAATAAAKAAAAAAAAVAAAAVGDMAAAERAMETTTAAAAEAEVAATAAAKAAEALRKAKQNAPSKNKKRKRA